MPHVIQIISPKPEGLQGRVRKSLWSLCFSANQMAMHLNHLYPTLKNTFPIMYIVHAKPDSKAA